MKIIRAPLRISLFGGGTDLDPFCSQHGSTIISFAINRYMYLAHNPRPTGGCRLTYSEVEELEAFVHAEHTMIRRAAFMHGLGEPCSLTIVCDVPKGTGLGSSSALAVCIERMAWNWTRRQVVWEAARLEMAISRAGWQDYLPAAHGGFNVYHIHPETEIRVTPIASDLTDLINTNGLLLYTGTSRPADSILGNWQKSDVQLMKIKTLADEVAEQINDISVEHLAQYLNATWLLKREISHVSTPILNRQYAQAVMAGALGGKLLGAGAGGCWFFLVPPEKRQRVVDALGLTEIPFQVEERGVQMWDL